MKRALNWSLLFILIISISAAFYFRLYDYLDYRTLQTHHAALKIFTQGHYISTVLIFMLIYAVSVTLSIPGAVFLSLAGGYLFGPLGVVYVVCSATLGSAVIFFIIRSTLGEWLAGKSRGWALRMEAGFRENAFYYLLTLRLIPIFPFWAINIAAALLAVRFSTFIIATFFGIIPGAFVYVMVGNSFTHLLETDHPPDIYIIFTPPVLLPLMGLSLLSLVPVIYKKWKGHQHGKQYDKN